MTSENRNRGAKRAAEEITGDGSAPEESAAKQRRTENVSPVVFLWNLPEQTDEKSIRHFCYPFGDVSQVLHIQRKRHALVEMSSEEGAQRLVQRYRSTPAYINGFQIHCAFSKHPKLILRNEEQSPTFRGHNGPAPNNAKMSTHTAANNGGGAPQHRVLVARSDGITESTLSRDILMLVRESGIGDARVLKVFILGKKGMAFIEFESAEMCAAVEHGLKQRHVYLNGMIVDFIFSKREFLEGPRVELISRPAQNPQFVKSPAEVHPQFVHRIPIDVIEDAKSVGIPLGSIHMVPAVKTANGFVLFDEYLDSWKMNNLNNRKNQAKGGQRGRVVMISNLNEKKVDCDRLFTLCGAFGDVERVKIAFTKRDTAFVQMTTEADAHNLCQLIQGLNVFGNRLNVKMSKMDEIRGVTDKPVDTGEILTKDYSDSDKHRYRQSRHRKNINIPGAILHVSNINKQWVEETGEGEALKELSNFFGDKEVAFVPNSTNQCFVQCKDVEEAVQILVEKHWSDFHSRPLRISFSARNRMPKANGAPSGQLSPNTNYSSVGPSPSQQSARDNSMDNTDNSANFINREPIITATPSSTTSVANAKLTHNEMTPSKMQNVQMRDTSTDLKEKITQEQSQV